MTVNIIKPKSKRFQDLTGQRFERIVVVSYAGNDIYRKSLWLCRCDCGNEKVVFGCDIKRGHSKSCGCLRNETTSKRSTKHGNSRSPELMTTEYRAWAEIKKRCSNINCKDYKHYGGRGITVCERWLESFENFLADMGKKPTPKHSIDRVNNEKGYSPDNCKWSTSTEQNRNRRDNRFITHNHETLTVAEWSEKLGIKYETIKMRVNRGWSIERALTQ